MRSLIVGKYISISTNCGIVDTELEYSLGIRVKSKVRRYFSAKLQLLLYAQCDNE